MKKILIPMPSYGADPTEIAIPWKMLKEEGFDIRFITPDGKLGRVDNVMLSGKSLGILKTVLSARADSVNACQEMELSEEFCNPIKYQAVQANDFDALYLPGGHDKGVREYLESKILQRLVVDFFQQGKPVAAVCHGVVLVARSIDPLTKQSVIHNYKTTALLQSQELTAYNLTRLWLKDYYLTYPEITVQKEVTEALSNSEQFIEGPTPIFRDDMKHLERGFTVKDGHYLSARWPGDIYNLSTEFIKMIHSS